MKYIDTPTKDVHVYRHILDPTSCLKPLHMHTGDIKYKYMYKICNWKPVNLLEAAAIKKNQRHGSNEAPMETILTAKLSP